MSDPLAVETWRLDASQPEFPPETPDYLRDGVQLLLARGGGDQLVTKVRIRCACGRESNLWTVSPAATPEATTVVAWKQ